VEKEQASPKVREVYQKVEDNGAKVINLFKAIANSPTNILLNVIRLGNSIIGQTGLSPKLRELAILHVAKLSGCEYEYTDEVAREVSVTDQTFNVLKKFLSDQTIVELTVTIGYYSMLARVLVPLQVEVDESYIGSVSELIGRRGESK